MGRRGRRPLQRNAEGYSLQCREMSAKLTEGRGSCWEAFPTNVNFDLYKCYG